MVTRNRATPEPAPEDAGLFSTKHQPPITNHQSRPFSWAIRVYHEDADGSGVVYHANYLKFLERARTEWLRSLGFEQTDLAARHGVAFVVRSLSIEYLKPAAFNDELVVTAELAQLQAVQIALVQSVTRGSDELARASVRVACINTASFRPVRIPDAVREVLNLKRALNESHRNA